MFEFMNHLVSSRRLSLEELVDSEQYPKPYEIYVSGFTPCSEDVLKKAEEELGFAFPEQLRRYYLECGVGQAVSKDREMAFSDNNVLIPTHIPKLIAGTCSWMMP